LGDVTERDHLENLDLNGKIILTRAFNKEDGVVDWTAVDQDTDK
jgi:hypothetical protein